eukprot:TRINITY_DN19786_c0_g1_i1.p1 TRINITY_DN19786_c0_g1~~TRINITY_DN19786_c0_g1_i1.p1  ORF type:complete len:308 (-),score=34.81 TRINITY_DN19786_c0_g1_i1:114-1037(-)
MTETDQFLSCSASGPTAERDEHDVEDQIIMESVPAPTRPKWRMLSAAGMMLAFLGTCSLMARKGSVNTHALGNTIERTLVMNASFDFIQTDDENYDFEYHHYFKTHDGNQDECHGYLDKSIKSVTMEHNCRCSDWFNKGPQQCEIPHTWSILRLEDDSAAIVELFPEHMGFGTNEVFCKISKSNNWGDHNGLQDVSGKTLRDIYAWGRKRLRDHPTYGLWKQDMTEWHDDPDLSGKKVDDKDTENCITFAWALVYFATGKACQSYGCACGWQRQNMCCVDDNKWYDFFTACRQSITGELCSGGISRR